MRFAADDRHAIWRRAGSEAHRRPGRHRGILEQHLSWGGHGFVFEEDDSQGFLKAIHAVLDQFRSGKRSCPA